MKSRPMPKKGTILVKLLCLFVLLCLPHFAYADPPQNPVDNFRKAKIVARDDIYGDHLVTFYCGCAFTPKGRSGGVIDPTVCGYQPRKSATRGGRLEWEHVVPAWFFGHTLSCWQHPELEPGCKPSDNGRECCERVNEWFRHAEADLHNLVPSVGELNGDRSNYPYGMVPGEDRAYGRCDFEVGRDPKRAEPCLAIRGDVARIWLYMAETYGFDLTKAERTMFECWSVTDEPDKWEIERDNRIKEIQGNLNPYVAGQEQ